MRKLILIVPLILGAPLSAQVVHQVDPGREDASPIGVTTRKLQVDQRVPTDFGGVYQLSKVDAFGRGQSTFMRVQGAIYAVFPRSVYIATAQGTVADVPPGTVFWIGRYPEPPPPRVESDIFLRLDAPEMQVPSFTQRVVPNSLITDEPYRWRRIGALLDMASGS